MTFKSAFVAATAAALAFQLSDARGGIGQPVDLVVARARPTPHVQEIVRCNTGNTPLPVRMPAVGTEGIAARRSFLRRLVILPL